MTDPSHQPSHDSAADEGQTFAAHAARVLADSNCQDIIVQDLRGLSQVTDFFVIASGTSHRQIQSVADDVARLARHEGREAISISGRNDTAWVVADFFDVVIHLFDPQTRSYYDLESLWHDAARVDWRSMTKPGQFTQILARQNV
ncbi:MAG: ribosome silencing factor [Planctomycetes bacterium]|nr:ribosome silencing factor [Planctomycetota bacterium]